MEFELVIFRKRYQLSFLKFALLVGLATPSLGQSNDADSFFQTYNSDAPRMTCQDPAGNQILVEVKGDQILLDGYPTKFKKHPQKLQYYVDGSSMNLDFFFDFEEKILINLMNGEELMRLKCR